MVKILTYGHNLNNLPLRNQIAGPLPQDEFHKKVSSIIRGTGPDKFWNLEYSIPFPLPNQIKDKITSIALPFLSNSAKDTIIWNVKPNGIFSLSSAYNSLFKITNSENNPNTNSRWIWKSPANQREKMFLWKCFNNGLPVLNTLNDH